MLGTPLCLFICRVIVFWWLYAHPYSKDVSLLVTPIPCSLLFYSL